MRVNGQQPTVNGRRPTVNELRLFITALVFVIAPLGAAAQHLFFISKSTNRNIVCYDVQTRGEALDTDAPMHVYWHNNEERPGAEDELSFVQRTLAYGYKVKTCDTDGATVMLRAYGKRPIRICRHGGRWVATTAINAQTCVLERIHVVTKRKSPVNVNHIVLYGKALAAASSQSE